LLKPLADLNLEQQKIIKQIKGPVLVLSGTGTGRSKLIAHRVAYLLTDRNLNPLNILTLLPHNKSTAEMRARIGKTLPWLGSYETICAKILRTHIHELGMGHNTHFKIASEAESIQMIKDLLGEQKKEEHPLEARAVFYEIRAAKHKGLTSDLYKKAAKSNHEKKIVKIYSDYTSQLKALGLFDYADLILLTVQLFKKLPKIHKEYQNQFEHILVDEYEDLTPLQYQLVKLFYGKNTSIFAVADNDQQIATSYAGSLKPLQSFEKDFKGAKTFTLEQNFRSSQTILDIANMAISRIPKRKEKRLWSMNGKGEIAIHYHAFDEEDEVRFVVDEIETNRLESRTFKNLNSYAVLYRTPKQAQLIESFFQKRNIVYKTIGKLSFYQKPEIQDLLKYLRVVANPADNEAVLKLINIPPRGIPDAMINQIRDKAEKEDQTVFEYFKNVKKLNDKIAAATKEFRKFLDKIEKYKDLSIDDIVLKVIEDSGYAKWLRKEKNPENKAKMESLKELAARAKTKRLDIPGFLHSIALMRDVDHLDDQGDAVTVVSINDVKGLEFPIIFLLGLEEGLLPRLPDANAKNGDLSVDLDEERRLFYVAVSRAKSRLYLSNSSRHNEISRFIKEAPRRSLATFVSERLTDEDLAKFKEEKIPFMVRGVLGNLAVEEAIPEKVLETYRPGDVIEHEIWGRGKVIKSTGSELDLTLEAKFPGQGDAKIIMVRYAPIKKIEKKKK
jgi:DNA helicase-2/ATP-dependent DNA helicase PcrA